MKAFSSRTSRIKQGKTSIKLYFRKRERRGRKGSSSPKKKETPRRHSRSKKTGGLLPVGEQVGPPPWPRGGGKGVRFFWGGEAIGIELTTAGGEGDVGLSWPPLRGKRGGRAREPKDRMDVPKGGGRGGRT